MSLANMSDIKYICIYVYTHTEHFSIPIIANKKYTAAFITAMETTGINIKGYKIFI